MARMKMTRAQALELLAEYKAELSRHQHKQCKCMENPRHGREIDCLDNQVDFKQKIKRLLKWLERNG
jgi:hypothetical protein